MNRKTLATYRFFSSAVIFVSICFTTHNLSADSVQNDREKLLRFADQWFSELEYYRAVTEYRRFLSYYPETPMAPSVHLRIFDCYFLGNRHAEALAWARRTRDLYTLDNELVSKGDLCIGRALLKLGNLSRARQHFATAVESARDPETLSQAYYGIGVTYLREDRWEEGSEAFASVPPGTLMYDRAHVAASESLGGAQLALKRPLVAGLLNVVPGVGYAYVGMPKTAVSALLVNSLFAAATYSALNKKETGVGVLLGVLSFGWYTGGIYGAVVNANKHNLRIKEDFWDRF